jgi:hypothetical protein
LGVIFAAAGCFSAAIFLNSMPAQVFIVADLLFVAAE